jgi:hypothetical protein
MVSAYQVTRLGRCYASRGAAVKQIPLLAHIALVTDLPEKRVPHRRATEAA